MIAMAAPCEFGVDCPRRKFRTEMILILTLLDEIDSDSCTPLRHAHADSRCSSAQKHENLLPESPEKHRCISMLYANNHGKHISRVLRGRLLVGPPATAPAPPCDETVLEFLDAMNANFPQ